MDYTQYRFSKQELIVNLGLFLVIDAAIAYLFYRSLFLFAGILPLFGLFLKKRKEEYCKQRQNRLAGQFLSGMQAVATALTAGYSVETAFADAYEELGSIYDEQEMIMTEFRYINTQLHMNRNLEELLRGLADRSGVEDIGDFAEIFAVAKRTGGNLIAIIRNTIWNISQKEDTRKEIETLLAAKRMEQNIMSAVPAFILLYVQTVSPGFLDGMYHNLTGIVIMTICLGIYAAGYVWGKKIVNIEV